MPFLITYTTNIPSSTRVDFRLCFGELLKSIINIEVLVYIVQHLWGYHSYNLPI